MPTEPRKSRKLASSEKRTTESHKSRFLPYSVRPQVCLPYPRRAAWNLLYLAESREGGREGKRMRNGLKLL